MFVDQDVLNVVCRDRIRYLDEAWNYCGHFYNTLNPTEGIRFKPLVDRIGENFFVIHFAGRLKPWCRPEMPFSRYFWRYAKNSVFFERIVEAMGKTAAEELNKQKTETDKLKNQNARLQYDLDCVHDSVSFRIGRAITWVPRKLRGGVRCLRDNGLRYTGERVLIHLRLR